MMQAHCSEAMSVLTASTKHTGETVATNELNSVCTINLLSFISNIVIYDIKHFISVQKM